MHEDYLMRLEWISAFCSFRAAELPTEFILRRLKDLLTAQAILPSP